MNKPFIINFKNQVPEVQKSLNSNSIKANKRKSVLVNGFEKDFNKKFLKAVELEPCLYNTTLAQYTDKNSHDEAWQRISSQFDESVFTCKDRLKNLRAGLTRYMKHRIQDSTSGTTGHSPRKPYYLLPFIKFLIPFTRVQKPDNFSEICDNIPETADKHSDQLDYVEIKYSESLSEEQFEEPKPIEQEDIIPTKDVCTSELPERESEEAPVSKKRKLTETNEVEQPPQMASNDLENTPEWHFFKSIMPDIMSMTPAQNRKFRMQTLCTINDICNENS